MKNIIPITVLLLLILLCAGCASTQETKDIDIRSDFYLSMRGAELNISCWNIPGIDDCLWMDSQFDTAHVTKDGKYIWVMTKGSTGVVEGINSQYPQTAGDPPSMKAHERAILRAQAILHRYAQGSPRHMVVYTNIFFGLERKGEHVISRAVVVMENPYKM